MLTEKEVQSRIKDSEIVQDGILNALRTIHPCKFISERKYINGIIADFTVIEDEDIRAIIECKSGKINVTDYVRGIGQLLQYEYFYEIKAPYGALEYSDKFSTIYFFPSTVIKNNEFNVADFKYPKTTMILELNESNNAVREISREELQKLNKAQKDNIVAISQYYFRDNRLFEYYILIRYLLQLENKGIMRADRKEVEKKLSCVKVINNKNWRNAFITLSSLGFLDFNNLLTMVGKQMAIKSFEQFALEMYKAYTKPYIEEILFLFQGRAGCDISNEEMSQQIKKRYRNRDVLFLTQSRSRYISSWLNIMRDDFGILEFQPRNKAREVKYWPDKVNDDTFMENIKEFGKASEYISGYEKKLRKGEI